jgi:UDP-glucuronate 4-epimerase
MKVLITGGAGFIGSHLAERVLKDGHRVVIIDDFNDFYPEAIKRDNISGIKADPQCRFYETDITETEEMKKIFLGEKPECVVHLAARAGVRPSLNQPYLYEKVNVVGTLNVLESCRGSGVEKLIFGSSSSVYGDREKVPFREDDALDNIVSPYAATKAAGEHFCRSYHNTYGLKIAVLRFFTVYGPRQRPEMAICKFARQIDTGSKITLFGDGSSSRDYTYVDDIIQGIMGCLTADLSFEVINLGESRTVPLRDLVKIIEDNIGKKAVIEYAEHQKGDVFRTYADVSKAKKMLNYRPKVPIEQGIKMFAEWYRKKYKNGIYVGKK